MKKFITGVFALTFLLGSAFPSFAAPTNQQIAANNPQTVAYYTTGLHGIAGEPYTHSGTDYVKANGNSGNFDQWFCGTATSPDQMTECEHSVWLSIGSATMCPGTGVLVENANQAWGSYLSSGNYCVLNNDANAH